MRSVVVIALVAVALAASGCVSERASEVPPGPIEVATQTVNSSGRPIAELSVSASLDASSVVSIEATLTNLSSELFTTSSNRLFFVTAFSNPPSPDASSAPGGISLSKQRRGTFGGANIAAGESRSHSQTAFLPSDTKVIRVVSTNWFPRGGNGGVTWVDVPVSDIPVR